MARSTRPSRRPTLEESAEVDELVREAAIESFLANGFDGTTMDGVARGAGVTRATLYARYPDKRALFKGVIHWALKERDVDTSPVIDTDDLRGALLVVARAAHARTTDPERVRLSVLLMSESPRFPELVPKTHQFARYPDVQTVVELLHRHDDEHSIDADDAELAAELFLAMVATHPARLAALGLRRPADDEARYLEQAVDLFLGGIRR